MARNVVNSRFSFARNIILVENMRLRSSQPRKAAKRCTSVATTIKIAVNKQIENSKLTKSYAEVAPQKLKVES